jgi:hypothetical protein
MILKTLCWCRLWLLGHLFWYSFQCDNSWTFLGGDNQHSSTHHILYQPNSSFIPSPRYSHLSCFNSYLRKVYVFGGVTLNTTLAADFYSFDLVSLDWTFYGDNVEGHYADKGHYSNYSWPKRRSHGSLLCDNPNGLVYLWGGITSDGTDYSETEFTSKNI